MWTNSSDSPGGGGGGGYRDCTTDCKLLKNALSMGLVRQFVVNILHK